MDQQNLQQSIVDEMGLADLPEDKQQELTARMTEALLKRIFIETEARLDEKSQARYEKMIEDGTAPEEIENFLTTSIDNYTGLVDRIISDFKKEMMAIA